jgi:CNT family concentrative nucleoside transporter
MSENSQRAVSFLGLFVMLLLSWLLSSHKSRVKLRVVLGGLLLQFAFALIILRTTAGRRFFDGVGAAFRTLIDFVDAGAEFVFGPKFQDFYVAFKVLPTIIFFSSLMSILYHLGLVQRVVAVFARVMQVVLGTSGAESLSASANIFVGQTEAPLVVRPYIDGMTRSELMAVMVGGFATIAGGVLAAYVGMGIDPVHLVTASVISAPAALVVAKVLQPEVDHPLTLGVVEVQIERTTVNVIDAAAVGAADGMKLALNVAAMLIAFLALIAMCDAAVVWCGTCFGRTWSLAIGLGYAFAPLAWIMGIEARDCLKAGEILGLKMVANEFVAYAQLSDWMRPDSAVRLSDRTVLILTYALCGFSNFGSIGIQIGGIGSIAPSRRTDLARLGLRAMLGGTLACCMTACIAGVLL